MVTLKSVDAYLSDGCGRCSRYRTPYCSVITNHKVLVELRAILLESGLIEEIKWSQPCYTLNRGNVLMIAALKEYACISFFKGFLLTDTHNLLVSPGQHSRAVRLLKFVNVSQVRDQVNIIKAYIQEAISIEQSGEIMVLNTEDETIPDELQDQFDVNPKFELAFYALTKGRQRGYLLHFSQAKQTKTRLARITKWQPKIMLGEGMHDAYKAKKK